MFFAKNPESSWYCFGAAVDVCLCYDDGKELLFPPKVDVYDKKYVKQILEGNMTAFVEHLKRARCDYANTKIKKRIENRELLKELMNSIGLEGIESERWQYNLPDGKIDRYPLVELNARDFD